MQGMPSFFTPPYVSKNVHTLIRPHVEINTFYMCRHSLTRPTLLAVTQAHQSLIRTYLLCVAMLVRYSSSRRCRKIIMRRVCPRKPRLLSSRNEFVVHYIVGGVDNKQYRQKQEDDSEDTPRVEEARNLQTTLPTCFCSNITRSRSLSPAWRPRVIYCLLL